MVELPPEFEISSTSGEPADIRNITGTVTLPTGAATSANQDAEVISLASLDSKFNAEDLGTSKVLTPGDPDFLLTYAGYGGITIQVDSGGLMDGPLQFLGTIEGGPFLPIYACDTYILGGQLLDSTSVDGRFAFNISSYTNVKFSYGGTVSITVYVRFHKNPSVIFQIQDQVYVNVGQIGGTTISRNSGIADAGTQRVSIATDNVVHIDDNSGSITVDGTVTANQGGAPWTVSQSGTWNIGTISTVTSLTQMNGQAIAMGTGVRTAGTQRVTIATDDSVPVTGTFWQATQPVSGTVTANAGTNLNTSLLALEAGGNLASIKTNTDNLSLAQGANTSGQLGNLIYGAVTTAAPSYTTDKSSPLSLDVTGNLRVRLMTSIPSGSNIIGKVGIDQTTPGTTNGVQVNAALPSGTNNIGDVDIVSGTITTVTSLTQMNGAAISMDTGPRGAGVQRVTLATNDLLQVYGNKTNNLSTPGANNFGTLPAVANAADPSWTETAQVALSSDLAGYLRVLVGSGATNIGKAEDSNSVSADVGVPAMAIQKATPANTAGTDGDYAMLQMSAGRLWASATIDAALPAGTALIGKVGIDQTTVGTTNAVAVAQIGANTVLTGNGVTGTGSQRVTIASDNTAFSVNATPPTLTKGTQGATGFSTQDLKDAGRNQVNFFMAIQIVTTNTDALLSLTGYKSGAAVGATTTPAVVTAAKTYRITSITMDYTTIVTTPGSVRFTLRANLSGTVAIGSPAVCSWEVGEPTGIAPVAGKKNTVHLAFPDGLEFAAGTGIGISQVGLNTVGAAAAVGYGRIAIAGYEY